MITIPFVKAHGARNDFLLTWRAEIPPQVADFSSAAVAICDRHIGVGADGWIIVSPATDADAAIELWNSDGSRSEISGNGTRCAALLLHHSGIHKTGISISTGAGIKHLQLLSIRGYEQQWEMNMGRARIEELHWDAGAGRDAVVLNVGNPQCAVFSSDFGFDWRTLGSRLERHPRFPNRTNVSFLRVIDRHNLEVRIWERGAGETMSSGTGSTGAGAAAMARGWVESPVRVLTPAGPLDLRWESDDIYLAGPAEIVAKGSFYWNPR